LAIFNFINNFNEIYIGDWGLGIGGWGVVGWGANPQHTPHTPTPPTPQKKYKNFFFLFFLVKIFFYFGVWVLGFGVWVLGYWAQAPIPNPQSYISIFIDIIYTINLKLKL